MPLPPKRDFCCTSPSLSHLPWSSVEMPKSKKAYPASFDWSIRWRNSNANALRSRPSADEGCTGYAPRCG